MAFHNVLGKWGENLAAEYLMAKGYAIADQNWRSEGLEIDIVAFHNNRVVFIEVKTRHDAFARPEEAVDRRRISRMVRAADMYVRAKNLPHDIQYDIIAICGVPEKYEIVHIEDAFFAPLRGRRR